MAKERFLQSNLCFVTKVSTLVSIMIRERSFFRHLDIYRASKASVKIAIAFETSYLDYKTQVEGCQCLKQNGYLDDVFMVCGATGKA